MNNYLPLLLLFILLSLEFIRLSKQKWAPPQSEADNCKQNKTVQWLFFAIGPFCLKQEFLDNQEFCHTKITSCGPDGGGGVPK